MEYLFTAITPRSILTRSGSISLGLISVKKELFRNYLYSSAPCAKNNLRSNTKNVQCTRFPTSNHKITRHQSAGAVESDDCNKSPGYDIALSAGAVESANYISARTLHNLYETKQSDGGAPVQKLWECGVPLYCHCSQVHSGPKWLHLKRSRVRVDLNCWKVKRRVNK